MDDLLKLARSAAEAASKTILSVYSCSDVKHIQKNDKSPLTAADLKANEAIQKLLSKSRIPILSEEEIIPYEQRRNWSQFWLVDPLDGTKDFLVRNGEFTVNIALIENGNPVLGVVQAPALGQVWYACSGQGAWTEKEDIKTSISALAPWTNGTRMLTSNFHDAPSASQFAELNGVTRTISAGSSLKLARIAASEAEFYPRFAGTSEWDIAAGDAILREAGGMLRTISGEYPSYNTKSLRNPYFIVWRPPIEWSDIKFPHEIFHEQ